MSAVGDVTSAISSISDTNYLDIQPTGTIEWVIHNIYHADDIELYFYDGSNNLLIEASTGPGVLTRYAFHCTNSIRIRVKNTSGGSQLIGYDGIITRL